MKRLVLCCDGTWGSPVAEHVSNIEKLARAVRAGVLPDGTQQVVCSLGGVGARGYRVDQVLGGAFGYGLTRNVVDGYRFLALNYEPGDEIWVFGYSRGAYTARSVVGMVSAVGLLTPEALVTDRLGAAERAYRDRSPQRSARQAAFRRLHSRDGVRVTFLGVFDTVGALGVPGPARARTRFHDVRLSPLVDRARQALAIDEHRITFAPCLWEVPDGDAAGRVEQVWFPGTHGDVGGGGARSGLADIVLQWMADEARDAGLVLHEDRLRAQLGPADLPLECRTAPPWPYRVLNVAHRLRPSARFRGARRVLAARGADGRGWADAVRLAAPALRWYEAADGGYRREARNIGWWADLAGGDLVPVTEVVRAATDDARELVLR